MLNSLRPFLVLGILCCISVAHAQECVDDSRCRSQLLRVEVAPNALNSGGGDRILQSLQNFATTPALTNLIQRGYDIRTLPFPHFKDVCQRLKNDGNEDYRNINCETPGLCANTNLNPRVRQRICFRLPCTMLEGNRNAGTCGNVDYVYPTQIGFPGKLELRNIRLTPTSRSFQNGRATVCFNIDAVELNMNTRLTLDTTGTRLPDQSIQVDNINPRMTAPREVCMSASVDLTARAPVSNIRINYTNGPFITDDMLDDAADRLTISGLSGYSPEALQQVQREVAPALVQTLRASIEEGVVDGLQKTFGEELQAMVAPFTGAGRGQSTFVRSSDFMSELGYANMGHQEALDLAECSVRTAARQEIPANHPCRNYRDLANRPYDFTSDFNRPFFMIGRVSAGVSGKNVTSASVKRRLQAMAEMLRSSTPPPFAGPGTETARQTQERTSRHHRDVADNVERLQAMINEISTNQIAGPIFQLVELQREGASVRVGVPEICDTVRPSTHAGRRIANCPVQVYADLNEMNDLMDRMWRAGRICQQGRGPFVPHADAQGRPLYESPRGATHESNVGGAPLGRGCLWNMDGMSCYIKSPPRISYDSRARNYRLQLGLEKCYREAGISTLWLGTFGGDLNIDVRFQPKACNGGDFCMDDPQAEWNVTPGSERYALRNTSWFRERVNTGLSQALNNALGDSIRIPLASALGENVPLRSEGRVDRGNGFFGVCLEVQAGTGATP